MSYVTETLGNLIHQTAFFNLSWGNLLMIPCCTGILIPGNQEGIRAVTVYDCIRYAAC